jgi:choline/glycine/proline betaine transport protein
LFGICTTLGLGAGLVNAGLSYLFGIEENITNQIIIIIVVAAIAMASVMSGLHRGIKILSEVNVWISVVLLLVFLFAGPTIFLLGFVVTNFGDYLTNFVEMGFWVDPDPDGTWQGAWTVFYWGWWISWAPFVGMFIARISRGRTIREFCLGALLTPTLICIVWFGIFGGAALHMAMFDGNEIIPVLEESISKPIFYMIEHMGLGVFTSVVALLALTLIVSYFVTSSDSATLVITTVISMGDPEPNRYYRMFWAAAQALAAIALLLAGGLDALKAGAMAAGLPFSIIMYLMIYGLLKCCIDELRPA